MAEENSREGERYSPGENPKKSATQSGIPLKLVYRPEDVAELDYEQDIGDPGDFPFTRGIHRDMYRGRVWTMRPLTGYGTPKMSNERIKFLLNQGGMAWTLAPDGCDVAGIDPDHPLSRHEVGVTGTSICTLEDMEVYFDGLPLGKVRPNMTVCQPSSAFWLSCYAAVAEKKGVAHSELLGGIQNDPFNQVGGMLEAQTRFFSLDLGVRLCCDTIEWCTLNVPKINCLGINAYNLRENGLSAAEEIAFGINSATTIAREILKRGTLEIDDFAPRISFFCACNIDFLEEIAKLRAFRRLYARIMKEEFGAKNPRSCWFRCAVETSGNSLTTQQPLNNIIRATIEALAATLGGCQSLFPACFDEGLTIPNELASIIALRTQQIIAYESNIVNSVDPLGGSFLIEKLTSELEDEAAELIKRIDGMGGTIAAMKSGWRDKQLIEAKLRYQGEIQRGERSVVGLNVFMDEGEVTEIPGGLFVLPPEVEKERIAYVKEFRKKRDSDRARISLEKLQDKVRKEENLIPAIIQAAKADATLGEITDAMRDAVEFQIDS